ncbi:MAG: isoleucine--tRNA ligase [Thermoprotei archaeon]|nr:MAG: isoleucine--tRNA ligase [Thermoprotei archaeon]
MLKGRYDPLKVEKWVLDFWKRESIPEIVRKKSWSGNAPVFCFLEGPPTANGFMHVGHARGRTLKDIKLRYYRMKGYRVWDQAGWDTQGLPVELEVERKFGFKTKRDIEVFGAERFVDECQKLVDYYIEHWRNASERLGLWLDYDHAYETRHPRYLDTAWRFLKSMWEKGYLYEDLRVVPVCPRCQTALSSHEVAQGYKLVKDPSLYFKIKLKNEDNTYMVVWTTTPWTIISNEALAVHPDEIYVKIKVGNEYWILAEKRLKEFVEEVGLQSHVITEKIRGSELVGISYEHPLVPEVPAHNEHQGKWVHRILPATWVSMEEGTGVVHIAPAHGPEDFELGKQYELPVFKPLMKSGYFGPEAGKYQGLWFIEANAHVIEDLRRKGLLIHIGEAEHEYPHCWRCGTKLMYYADRQWFIKVEPIKITMLDENSRIRWTPAWTRNRFDDWLKNARDWCISRERYWGTPLPIWTCTKCGYREALGSLEEVKRRALNPEAVFDHHRPWIDRVVLKCPKCGGEMKREPFVVDVWLDSGIAHTAALEQYGWGKLINELFPYDWITEAIDQTRGWFYTLMFTSVAWYGKAPYKSVLCQGLVLDKYGKKMSKSRGNVIWAYEFMEKYGADPTRLYLVAKAAPWDNINFDPDEVLDVKRQLDILWNSVNFAKTYMELDRWEPSKLDEDLKHLEPEDLWLLYELDKLVKDVEESIELDNPHVGARRILEFIVEVLSHRYITLVRPRVWIEEDTPPKRSVYATLYIAISTLLKVLAPYAPFIAEYLYQAFMRRLEPGAPVSIHAAEWPQVPRRFLDEKTWLAVDLMLEASELVLTLRSEAGIKRRWPIRKAVVVIPETSTELQPQLLERAARVLKVYANVKEVEVTRKDVELHHLKKSEGRRVKVYVDLTLDEETILEGLAREIVRRIQVMRKELKLPLDAMVEKAIVYTPDNMLRKAVEIHREFIARETRCKTVELAETKPEDAREWSVEGRELYILLVLEAGEQTH